MAKRLSAGILLYRERQNKLEVFLVHPGGPYWAKKDNGVQSIPKGELEEGDDLFETAKREFIEETGLPISGEFFSLSPLKQPSGKVVYAWAVKGDLNVTAISSNLFSMEWPPASGITRQFPEIDKGEWFNIRSAMQKLLPGQRPFLKELLEHLEHNLPTSMPSDVSSIKQGSGGRKPD